MKSVVIAALALVLGASTVARADQVIVLNSEEASYSVLSRGQRTETAAPAARPRTASPHADARRQGSADRLDRDQRAGRARHQDRRAQAHASRASSIAYQLGFSPDGKWFVTASYRLDHVDIYRYDGTTFTLANRTFIGRHAEPSRVRHRFEDGVRQPAAALPRGRLRPRDAGHQVERRSRQGAGRAWSCCRTTSGSWWR